MAQPAKTLVLLPEDEAIYDSLYRLANPLMASTVPNEAVIDCLRRSGLPTDQLSRIWELANSRGGGRGGGFDRAKFFVALRLVAMAQNKRPVRDGASTASAMIAAY